MKKIQFSLEGQEYIQLNSLLKVLTLVHSGGEAKIRINMGDAKVNGQVDYRKRKKLRLGEIVIFDNNEIEIIA